jgi:Reverse transcriptase (RNA-dependent DNA polymerase)
LLTSGKIRKTNSEYQSGITVVKKKDTNTYRMCVDYRELNKKITDEHFNVPLPQQVFMDMHGIEVFSKIDLLSAYHQIMVARGSERYTAFTTPFGNYEYTVMPFGLSIAPAIFQKAITMTLFRILSDKVAVYLDDILIATEDLEINKKLVTDIIRTLVDNNFHGNEKKCKFFTSGTTFLGLNINSKGIDVPQDYLCKIEKMDCPNTLKELQRYMGMVNFIRNYIPGLSINISTITNLLSGNGRKLQWTEREVNAFRLLNKTI